jgi:hypothetical protein
VVSCVSSLRTQGPITPVVRGFKSCVATSCSNRKSSAYGSLLSQGRRKRVQTFKQPQTQLRDLAAHFARGLLGTSYPLRSEGAGNAGRPMRPQPRMQCENKHTSIVTTVTPEIARHSPRNGFNGFLRALPGVRILGCHRHRRIKVCQTRSGRLASADLAPATGARTTRLRRPQHAPFVCARFVRSQAHESLPCNPRTRPTLPRPPHPAPRS